MRGSPVCGETLIVADSRHLLDAHGLREFSDFMSLARGISVARKRGRTVVRFELGERAFYLKRNRFHWGEFWKTLLRLRLPPRGARQEWQSILAVQDAGIPTVPPVAMGERVCWGIEAESFTLTEELYDTEPLENLIRREFAGNFSPLMRAEKRDLIMRVATLTRRLHGSGMYHQDLYLGHFFLGRDKRLYLIDLQRVVRCARVPRRYVVKDLGQLAFSAWETGGISRTDRMRFFHAYLGVMKLGAAEKKLVQRILEKQEKIARHTVKLLERRRHRGEIS
jgi:heptose I phosphotransferase